MKNIRYFGLILLSFGILFSLKAKTKVINSYQGEKPEWIWMSQENYIVADGFGITLDEAKNNAKKSLKKQVVTVAVDHMTSANPFFQSIKLEKEAALDLFQQSDYYAELDNKNHNIFYWERIKNLDTKSKTYHYFLQYQVSPEEIEETIDKIAFDNELSRTVSSVEKQLETGFIIDNLDRMSSRLKEMKSQLSNDDNRKSECEALLDKVEEKYKSIEVKAMLNVPGRLIVSQTINNRAVFSSNPPKVTSNCAEILGIENYDEQWSIIYNYNYCLRSLTDNIKVEFDNGGVVTSGEFLVDRNRERLEVKLSGAPIVIYRNKMIKLYIASSYRGDIVLERVVLNFNETQSTETRLNQLLDGAGLYTIRYLAPPGFFKVKTGDIVSGEIHYLSRRTGQKEVYKFYNQKLSVQWD